MGMFDTVVCEKPLPGERVPPSVAWLQTKSFDCFGQKYTITSDGRLLRDGALFAFEGVFQFYTFTHDGWFEYEACYRAGKLHDIRQLACIHEPPNAPRIITRVMDDGVETKDGAA